MNSKVYALLTCCLLNAGAYSKEMPDNILKTAPALPVVGVEELKPAGSSDAVSFEEYFKSLSVQDQEEWQSFAKTMESEQKEILKTVKDFFEKRPEMLQKYYEACKRPFNFELNFQLNFES